MLSESAFYSHYLGQLLYRISFIISEQSWLIEQIKRTILARSATLGDKRWARLTIKLHIANWNQRKYWIEVNSGHVKLGHVKLGQFKSGQNMSEVITIYDWTQNIFWQIFFLTQYFLPIFSCDKQLKKWRCHSACLFVCLFVSHLIFLSCQLCSFALLHSVPLNLCTFAPATLAL